VFIFIRALTNNIRIAAFVSLFFAIHPMAVESVTWITERKNVLFTFFYLSSLISYIWYLKNNLKNKYILFCLLFFILSLLSKTVAITLPFSLIAIDLYLKRKYDFKNILEKSIFLFISIAFGIILMSTFSADTEPESKFSLFQLPFLSGYSFTYYIIKCFLPLNLNVFHSLPSSIGLLPAIYYVYTIAGILILGFATFLAIKYKAHQHVILSGFFFYISSIAIVLHIVPIGGSAIVAERYSYLSNIGLLLIAGYFLNHFLESKTNASVKLKPIIYIVLLGMIVFFSYSVVQRNKVWQNSISVWNEALKDNKEFEIGYNNRGNVYKELKEYTNAINDYDMAVKIYPQYYQAYNNRGLTYSELKEYDKALNDFDKALQINPEYSDAYNNRGAVLLELKEYQKAINDFDRALIRNPANADAYANRGNCWFALGDTKKALEDFSKALEIRPEFTHANFLCGNIKYSINDFEGAVIDYTNCLKYDSNYSQAYFNLGMAYMNLNKPQLAIIEYNNYIELEPSNYEAYIYRGNAKILLKQFNEALNDFNKAISMQPDNQLAFFNRGVTYYYLNKQKEACEDWRFADKLGHPQAKIYVLKICK
jgi:tetratricopeptide (TPR) repeat protein